MNHPETPLKTKHTFLDFLYWNMVVSVPFITACIAIVKESIAWLIIYIIACILLVMVIYRFYCIHCPHYHQNGKDIKMYVFLVDAKIFQSKIRSIKPAGKGGICHYTSCHHHASHLLVVTSTGIAGDLPAVCRELWVQR